MKKFLVIAVLGVSSVVSASEPLPKELMVPCKSNKTAESFNKCIDEQKEAFNDIIAYSKIYRISDFDMDRCLIFSNLMLKVFIQCMLKSPSLDVKLDKTQKLPKEYSNVG